ncbi:MAG: DUF1036 domain-containing protein [Rhodospirillaceae bacterium]
MKALRLLGVATIVMGTWMAMSAPAHAWLRFCNDTGRTQNVAVGYQEGDDWVSEGWWVLSSGECKKVLSGDLRYRNYYYRIKSGGVSRKQDASYYFCTETQPFTIVGSHSKGHCSSRGHYRRAFKKMYVGEARDFTIDIR